MSAAAHPPHSDLPRPPQEERLIRALRVPRDALVNGLSYAAVNYLMNAPQPLDPEWTWGMLTGPERPLRRWLREGWPPKGVRRWRLNRIERQDLRDAIPKHYDVSNEFYRLFLDQRFMFYSCADFATESDSLEQAQENKARFIYDLLEPKAGERILDLGCGWGSMLSYVAQRLGDGWGLVGYTLSKEQSHFLEANFDFDIRLKDFTKEDFGRSTYDRAYSIAAWEAVRPSEADALLARVFSALKPGGRFVNHFFCRLQDQEHPAALTAQLFFPGHAPLSYRGHVKAFERAGFRIARTTAHDYRPTLRCWFDNLVRNRKQALSIVDVRTYNRYLTFFAVSYRYFDDRTGVLFRFVLEKPA